MTDTERLIFIAKHVFNVSISATCGQLYWVDSRGETWLTKADDFKGFTTKAEFLICLVDQAHEDYILKGNECIPPNENLINEIVKEWMEDNIERLIK